MKTKDLSKNFRKELAELVAEKGIAIVMDLAADRLTQANRLASECLKLFEQTRALLHHLRSEAFEHPNVVTLANTCFIFEVIHICKLWDRPSINAYSIPTLIEFAREPALRDELCKRWDVTGDPGLAPLAPLDDAIRLSDQFYGSAYFESFKNIRDMNAHPITMTRAELKGLHLKLETSNQDILYLAFKILEKIGSVVPNYVSSFREMQEVEHALAQGLFAAITPAVRTFCND